MAGPKGKRNSVCKDPEGRDTCVCTCPSAVRRNMMFLGGGGG